MSKVDNVKIRMYNTGSVGDCLLLLFQQNGKTTFTMLIDCGGYKTSKDAVTKCVNDIITNLNTDPDTNRPYIDLVLLTHEHEDHASGFNLGRDLFNSIDFKQVWMSWVEDDTDPLAKELYRQKGKKVKALTNALVKHQKKLQGMSTASGSALNRALNLRKKKVADTLEILRFESGEPDKRATNRLKISDAMKYVKDKSKLKSKAKMFKKPGQVIADLPGAEGVKFLILGPPYDQDLSGIKNDEDSTEIFKLSKQLTGMKNELFMAALDSAATNNFSSPFSKRYQVNDKDKAAFHKMYNGHDMKWRQIEEDWLDSSDELAIAITSYVNNTSLAIAIELPGEKVLLFPADAQSGNWKSWHDKPVAAALKKNGGKNADDLLKDTVFYKVGHHGSHNGTASASGLDRMTNKNLVAFMPLVLEKVPSTWNPDGDNFPAAPLYKKLIEHSKGALIRTDEGLIKDKKAKDLREQNLSNAQINKLTKAAANELFKEWEVSA